MIFAAIINTESGRFIDVIEDRDTPPTEEECEQHADRLREKHTNWTSVTFYTIPTHPHDPDAYTAATLWDDIEDNQETFAKVLEKQQQALHRWVKPGSGDDPDPDEG